MMIYLPQCEGAGVSATCVWRDSRNLHCIGRAVIRIRLVQAGARLAWMLNETLR